MILQRLAEHYERIAASGDEDSQLAPPGFSRQKISFCIVLEPDGRLNGIQSMQQQKGKALVATTMLLPGQGKPSGQGLNPCFLWDNGAYTLGWSADSDKRARAALSFESFRANLYGVNGSLGTSQSPPAWGRGLKLCFAAHCHAVITSPPAWGRGLKLQLGQEDSGDLGVAPRVGAWIETSLRRNVRCG